MAKLLKTNSIYYNDVNLIAQPCKVVSRKQIPVELNRIIVSPMQSIVGETFAVKANQIGLTLALHRFCSPDEEAYLFNILPNKENVFVSIGLNDWDRVKVLSKNGAKNWIIDMANGYMRDEIKKTLDRLIYHTNVEKIMFGNIHTAEGYVNLSNINLDPKIIKFIRVGIAGGSPCATNDSTGFNRGPITELMEINNTDAFDPSSDSIFLLPDPYIVADGGIKNAGYAAKAFGAGAHYVMMGGYFSKALEAETHLSGDGTYWGGASHKQQLLQKGIKHRHSEGKEFKIQGELKPLQELVDELWGGLSSAVSYSGYSSLTEFIGNGTFELKQNSLPPRR